MVCFAKKAIVQELHEHVTIDVELGLSELTVSIRAWSWVLLVVNGLFECPFALCESLVADWTSVESMW